MARGNTLTSYGSVTKTFHWVTALLILSMIPLGFVATDLAYNIKDTTVPTTEADIQRTVWLFSLHKTVGVALFFTALLRITWAIVQPKPKLLNGDKGLEAWAAVTVHWLLYSSLVIVPLSGWIHHAATTGFAPIWWPLGQSLPFVPKDPVLADQTATLHAIAVFVMMGALGLHIAGALKHHVIDKDATLRRMLPGRVAAVPSSRQPGEVIPVFSAVAVWGAVILVGTALSAVPPTVDAEPVSLETVESDWVVTDGSLEIAVQQFGSEVTGSFGDWTAAIDYTDEPDAMGKHGTVQVTVNVASLSLGSVTDQAKGADYFDLATFPTANFSADILSSEGSHIAKGNLTIKDQSIPIEMPFDLNIDGDLAAASGKLTVDRRDFLIGMGTADAATLGFDVTISFTLNAARGEPPKEDPQPITKSETAWRVDDGQLQLSVSQFGSAVGGRFETWSADIDYSETADEIGQHGQVSVLVDIASLTLGSVTQQAQGPDYFDAANHPSAAFNADIFASDTGHVAIGTLRIRDKTVPIEMPFTLSIDGNQATASGSITLDRREFGIGAGTTDEATLGFGVEVAFALTASRVQDTPSGVEEAALTPLNAWDVLDGALDLSVRQFGNEVTGRFEDWKAAIIYSDTPDLNGKNGTVLVDISIASLTLGSVTDQAVGPDYFDLVAYPTARFAADIVSENGEHVAKGTLSIKERSIPVEMPFELIIENDSAEASGTLTVDRRDFGIGSGTTDEATLGFAVEVSFTLSAQRSHGSKKLAADTLTAN